MMRAFTHLLICFFLQATFAQAQSVPQLFEVIGTNKGDTPVPYRVGDKWGLKVSAKEALLTPLYDSVDVFTVNKHNVIGNPYFRVYKNGKVGLHNKTYKKGVFYDAILPVNDRVLRLEQADKAYFLDTYSYKLGEAILKDNIIALGHNKYASRVDGKIRILNLPEGNSSSRGATDYFSHPPFDSIQLNEWFPYVSGFGFTQDSTYRFSIRKRNTFRITARTAHLTLQDQEVGIEEVPEEIILDEAIDPAAPWPPNASKKEIAAGQYHFGNPKAEEIFLQRFPDKASQLELLQSIVQNGLGKNKYVRYLQIDSMTIIVGALPKAPPYPANIYYPSEGIREVISEGNGLFEIQMKEDLVFVRSGKKGSIKLPNSYQAFPAVAELTSQHNRPLFYKNEEQFVVISTTNYVTTLHQLSGFGDITTIIAPKEVSGYYRLKTLDGSCRLFTNKSIYNGRIGAYVSFGTFPCDYDYDPIEIEHKADPRFLIKVSYHNKFLAYATLDGQLFWED